MKGFFLGSSLAHVKPRRRQLPHCGACGLYKTCNSPKMETSGEGRRRVLILGEAPGKDEDEEGIQFCGKSGQLLEKAIKDIGSQMRRDCWITNTLICRPPNNATPTDKQIDYCSPNLTKTLDELKPNVIIPLGGSAVKALMRLVWKEAAGPISRWVGWQIPNRHPNVWICPTYHPSYLARVNDPVLEMWFKRHLRAAFRLSEKPWDQVPDYRSQVRTLYNPSDAIDLLEEVIDKGWPVAFDYETNKLKPDDADAEIISCSVCWGKGTIAFPWHGNVVKVMGRLLRSRNPKIASNLKFEDRWTRRMFGRGVRNWLWDTMLAAHVIDNRQGITSIKFQSFIYLGAEAYDEHISAYMKNTKGKGINRLSEVPLSDLLVYNGLDSLLEYRVAGLQMKALRYPIPRGMVIDEASFA